MSAGKILTSALLAAACAVSSQEIRADLVPRIIGGMPMDPLAVPPGVGALVWSTSTDNFDGERCTTTLIAPRWALTAAHCVDGLEPADLMAVFGEPSLDTTAPSARHAIDHLAVHPGWNAATISNDIALVHLANETGLAPVTLATEATIAGIPSESNVTTLGWGAIDNSGTYVPDIHSVTLHFIPQALCDAGGYYAPFPITAGQFCAGDTTIGYDPPLIDGGSGACFGDSGGPLFYGTEQIGVTSFVSSSGCAEPGFPTVYSDVGHFGGWIADVQTQPDIHVRLLRTDTLNSNDTEIVDLAITNDSPVNAAGAFVVGIAGSAGATIVNLDVLNGGSCDPVSGTCPVTGLAPGEGITLPLVVARGDAQNPVVTAFVTFPGDYDTTNNSATLLWPRDSFADIFRGDDREVLGSLPIGTLLLAGLLARRRRAR